MQCHLFLTAHEVFIKIWDHHLLHLLVELFLLQAPRLQVHPVEVHRLVVAVAVVVAAVVVVAGVCCDLSGVMGGLVRLGYCVARGEWLVSGDVTACRWCALW